MKDPGIKKKKKKYISMYLKVQKKRKKNYRIFSLISVPRKKMKPDVKQLIFNHLVSNEQMLDRQQICQNRLCQAVTIFFLTGQLTSGLRETVDMIQLDFDKILTQPHVTFLEAKQGKCKLNY